MIEAFAALLAANALGPIPEDYRRLACGLEGVDAAFMLDMPTSAFLRRYRGDNAVLYMLATDADSTLDGVRFRTVEDAWPGKLFGEWEDGNAAIHRLTIGPFDTSAGTAPYTLAWDTTPRLSQTNWMKAKGTCTLVQGDTQ